MLYIPFRTFNEISDPGPLVGLPPHPYDEHDPQHNARWELCFGIHMRDRPHRFPWHILELYEGIDEALFNDVLDPDANEDEWEPTPPTQRRREQEWEAAARLQPNGQREVAPPRQYFGERDIDVLHDWDSDLRRYQLQPELDTFIARSKMGDGQVDGDVPADVEVGPDMLNEGQRRVYDHIVNRCAFVIFLTRLMLGSLFWVCRAYISIA